MTLSIALAVSLPGGAGAQAPEEPRLVKDVDPGPASSFAEPSARLGDTLVFVGTEPASGAEPWVTDGTRAGTRRLADTVPGAAGGAARTGRIAVLGDRAFFFVRSAAGDALWATDGTRSGTTQVTSPGGAGSPDRPSELVEAGGRLYFAAGSATEGRELWTSDGTAEGTVVVEDVRPGADGAGPEELTPWAGRVVFTHHDGTHGREPWISDGTAAGTRLLADVLPGAPGSQARVTGAGYTRAHGRVYFRARGEGIGVELFRTNRSGSGVQLFQDLARGAADSFPSQVTPVGRRLYVVATVGQRERVLVAGRRPGSVRDVTGSTPRRNAVPSGLTALDGRLVFTTRVGLRSTRLWVAKGDDARRLRVLPRPDGVQDVAVVGKVRGRVAVSRALPGRTPELYLTDGRRSGTTRLPFDARDVDSEFFEVARVRDTWFFLGETRARGYELYAYDLR